jgi:hypothetical protein
MDKEIDWNLMASPVNPSGDEPEKDDTDEEVESDDETDEDDTSDEVEEEDEDSPKEK